MKVKVMGEEKKASGERKRARNGENSRRGGPGVGSLLKFSLTASDAISKGKTSG